MVLGASIKDVWGGGQPKVDTCVIFELNFKKFQSQLSDTTLSS